MHGQGRGLLRTKMSIDGGGGGRFSESPPPPHLFQRLKSEGDVPDVILSGHANSEIQGFSPAGPDRETQACREMSPYCNYVFVSRSFYRVHIFPEETGPDAPGGHIGPRFFLKTPAPDRAEAEVWVSCSPQFPSEIFSTYFPRWPTL